MLNNLRHTDPNPNIPVPVNINWKKKGGCWMLCVRNKVVITAFSWLLSTLFLIVNAEEVTGNADAMIVNAALYKCLLITVSEDHYASVRYNLKTGKSWRLDEGVWVEVTEDGIPPASNYEVVITPLPNDFAAIRYDKASGIAWKMVKGKWVSCKEVKGDTLLDSAKPNQGGLSESVNKSIK